MYVLIEKTGMKKEFIMRLLKELSKELCENENHEKFWELSYEYFRAYPEFASEIRKLQSEASIKEGKYNDALYHKTISLISGKYRDETYLKQKLEPIITKGKFEIDEGKLIKLIRKECKKPYLDMGSIIDKYGKCVSL